ncbi:hypothetical protein BJF78_29255 [Pseudonocardia sp. CNS-139]|nr:hypothetical protein BJF78_29255 [Pseudonocardia sp. CNS-139]
MIDVTVKVPAERVAEFYSMFGGWLSSPPTVVGPEAADSEAHTPWAEVDVEVAAAVWSKFSETARALFSTLIDNPERKYSGDELSEMLGIPNGKHGVAGVLAWPGRHCFAAGRALPWSWESPEEGAPAVYWFTGEIATLFRQARAM